MSYISSLSRASAAWALCAGLACMVRVAPAGAWVATAPLEVRVDGGVVRGALEHGVIAFEGIPYAAPPVGALRWAPPQPVKRWRGVRPALQFGPDCAQLPTPGDDGPVRTVPRENCLYVNVWRPKVRPAHGLPVMVWVYGGGFVDGGTSPAIHDGTQFARDGVVLVSFNYRLGNFGFFAFPALDRQRAAGLRGDYAFMDQIMALQWVRRNVASFGGDPRNVTIFGESAGGVSVNALLMSPLARGLFAKAIIESGAGRDNVARRCAPFPAQPIPRRRWASGWPGSSASGARGHVRWQHYARCLRRGWWVVWTCTPSRATQRSSVPSRTPGSIPVSRRTYMRPAAVRACRS